MSSAATTNVELPCHLFPDRDNKKYLKNDARFLAKILATGIYSVPHLPLPLPGETS